MQSASSVIYILVFCSENKIKKTWLSRLVIYHCCTDASTCHSQHCRRRVILYYSVQDGQPSTLEISFQGNEDFKKIFQWLSCRNGKKKISNYACSPGKIMRIETLCKFWVYRPADTFQYRQICFEKGKAFSTCCIYASSIHN